MPSAMFIFQCAGISLEYLRHLWVSWSYG